MFKNITKEELLDSINETGYSYLQESVNVSGKVFKLYFSVAPRRRFLFIPSIKYRVHLCDWRIEDIYEGSDLDSALEAFNADNIDAVLQSIRFDNDEHIAQMEELNADMKIEDPSKAMKVLRIIQDAEKKMKEASQL